MSNVPILNECGSCNMKFDNAAQLANHVKKFCSNSDYNNLEKLNKKYNDLRMGNGSLNQNLNERDKEALNIGPLTISQAKGIMKTQDPQFKQLERVAQKKREEDMEEQLQRYKQDRQAFRAQQKEDDEALSSLLNKYESKKDIELQQKVEKDYIQKALNESQMHTVQRQNLEQLQNERDYLSKKETRFADNVGGVMRGNTPNMMGQRNYQDLAIQEKSDKLRQLRQQQEELENERLRIMQNVDKNKNLDFKSRSQLGKAGASLVGFNVPDNQPQPDYQNRPLSKNNQYNGGQQPYQNGNQYQQYQPYDPNQIRTQSRDQILQQEKSKDWKSHTQKMLDDLFKIRNDYVRAGGQDPKFLQNLDNLEKFYKNARLKSANPINNSFDVQSISPATNNQMNARQSNPADVQQQNQMAQMVQQLQQQVLSLQNNSQKQAMLLQQEQEQARLRQELEALQRGFPSNPNPMMMGGGGDQFPQPFQNAVMFGKNGDPIIQSNTNNFTLSQINSKLHGFSEHGENPFSIFTPQQEYLLQNEVRTVDLDDEERLLANLQKEEVDQLRVMSRIPVGTEIYRFKMEQYKELSTVKAEMEKIANEQKLQRLRMEFQYQRREEDRQYDNEKWNDDQRKWILAQRVRKDLGPIGGIKQYDQNDGLVLHWDYILGLPKRTNFSQVVFGIFNRSDTLYAPKIVDPKECEVESSETVRCLIGDTHQIFDIPPNPDALLIIEVQLPYSKKQGDSVNKTESYGWTQLDLFDLKRELKRGKFKCPLYVPPTDQAITVQEIKQLEPIPGAWIYLRVAYPNDDDFSKQRSRYPDHTMHEYIIPQIHLRNDLGARRAVEYQKPPVMPRNPNQSYLPNMSYNQDTSQMQDISIPSQPVYEQPPDDGLRRGLSVSVLNVGNHQASSNMKVNAALLQNNKPVYDDQNKMCSFNTSVHNPFVEERMEDLPQNVVIPLTQQIQKGDMMNNKQMGDMVKWHEEYKFLRNIRQLFWSSDRKDIYVGIQVLEKDQPKNMDNKADLQSFNGNYNTIGWNFVKVNRPDGSIKSGLYQIDLFKGNPQRTPINEETLQKSGKSITVVIQEIIYDDTFFRKTPPKAKDKPRPAEQPPDEAEEYDNAAYISNLKPQFKTKTFQKRMGIDFYIDGLRFLPDKVTVTKIYMLVYNINYEVIFEAETCLPELDSYSFNPLFNFRRELRKDHIDPTSIALMTIVTLDKATNENRIVGFAAIPLFITTGPNPIHPTDQNLSDVFLYSGSYQLPLISQQVKRTVPFTIQKLYDLEKLPCASILVRIFAAPMDDQGLRALSINDFPDQKMWLQKGLFHPRPHYGKKIYNTSWYKATDAELDLFPFRALREDVSIKEAAYLIVKGNKINKRFKNTELYDYLDEQIALTDNNFMMDMMYFAKYSQKAGVKFIIDGLHQVPNEGQLYVAFFSINPPFGGFYPYLPNGNESDEDDPEDADNPEFRIYLQKKQDLKNIKDMEMQQNRVNTDQETQPQLLLPPDTTEVNLSSFFVWDSAASSPQYNNNWATFNKDFNRYQCVVVDVKSISFKNVDPKFEDVGWTIIPLFSYDGYVNSGIFQMPLIKGPVNPQFLYSLRKKNKRKYQNDNRRDRRQPWELLMEKMQERRSGMRMLEFTSIICRVLDAQRQGHYNVKFDTDRMNYSYIPQDKKQKYSYNEAVALKLKEKKKLSVNIPNKENPANFNKKITDACIQGFNLIKYL